MSDNSLNTALRYFEFTEANLLKCEKVLAEITDFISGVTRAGSYLDYEDNCRKFKDLLDALPKLSGWKPDILLPDIDEMQINLIEAMEIGEGAAMERINQEQIYEPSELLREYRYRFNQNRREVVRGAIIDLIDCIDSSLRKLGKLRETGQSQNSRVLDSEFDELKQHVAQIATLLGSSNPKPPRWHDLHRHMHFGLFCDLHDIIEHDWPAVKVGLRQSVYGETEPVPVGIDDLGELTKEKLNGKVITKLKWNNLAESDFERLVFGLISAEDSYENPEWLMQTSAPDRGRDLSVYRVYPDPLGSTLRQRIIIQCKHWQSKSIGISAIQTLREQIKLWEPPRVDICIIATSGRFTSDAVAWVEKHNQTDSALSIEMWPENHLERILASKPAIIAKFNLR